MALAAYLNPGGDLAADDRLREAVRDARLRQRVGHARPRPRLVPGPGRLCRRDLAHRPRQRRGADLPAPSRRHGPGRAHAQRAVGRPLPARHRREPPGDDERHARSARWSSRSRSCASTSRSCAARSAGAAAFEGKHYRAHWTLALPTRPAAPPIYLATLGPKMCELAGEIADGAILWLCTPDYVRDVARAGASSAAAGAPARRWRASMIAAAVPLAVTDDSRRRARGLSRRS